MLMKLLQIKDVTTSALTGEPIAKQALLNTIRQNITGVADVYLVMDHAVALGRYKNGDIHIKLSQKDETTDLPIEYVQELRVFRGDREFRALRNGEVFCWRLRIDNDDKNNGDDKRVIESSKIYRLDEIHKLWGSVRNATDSGDWSLLSTQRGSSIYFPGEVPLHGEKGLAVRNYIQFHSTDDGVVQFVDERLCSFVDWPNREAEV